MEATRLVVIDAVIEVCGTPVDDLVDVATLEDLDIDSLDLLEVAMIVEEKLGLIVEANHFDGVRTLGETIDRFVSLQRGAGDV